MTTVREVMTGRPVTCCASASVTEAAQGMRESDIGDVCSRGLVTVASDSPVEEAVALIREQAVRRLPVVEQGHAVGMVSVGDLAMHLDERSALAEISAAPPNN
jgi:CBS domain-containing protein